MRGISHPATEINLAAAASMPKSRSWAGKRFAVPLIPRAAVRSRPPHHIQVPAPSGTVTCPFIPWSAFHPRPLAAARMYLRGVVYRIWIFQIISCKWKLASRSGGGMC